VVDMAGNIMGCQRKTNKVMFKENYVIIFIKQKKKVYRVFVDLEDYEKVKEYCWVYDGYGYAVAGKYKTMIRMHKIIMSEEKLVDHINHNGFDNRKCNLRYATRSQNTQNLKTIHGVKRFGNKWRARITINRKLIHLGLFDTAKEAWKVRYREQRIHFQKEVD
jgi:hypothetical protein